MVYNMNFDEYKNIIRAKLDDYRYNHSLCVADEAKRLALIYNVNSDDAYLAGLLHDITKNFTPEEHLQIFSEFGIMLNDIEKNAEKLWHAISGAAYIEHVLSIKDQEIITAVRYHTTAREDMTQLEKLLYLADFTSADRDYDDIDIMRQKVEISMEAALDYALSYTISDLVSRGKPLHLDTVKAYNQNALKGEK